MKIKHLFFASALLCSFVAQSQNCDSYYPVKEGTVLTQEQYSAKGKLTGKTEQTLSKVTNNGGVLTIDMQVKSFDEKGAELGNGAFSVTCDKGTIKVDMRSFLDTKAMEGFKDMTVDIQSNDIEIPAVLSPGLTLNDGSINVTVSNQGMKLMSILTKITNRKVEAKETITVGTVAYECYKISSIIQSKSMFMVETKSVEWISKGVGVVRSESYDKNGKLLSYSILTSIK